MALGPAPPHDRRVSLDSPSEEQPVALGGGEQDGAFGKVSPSGVSAALARGEAVVSFQGREDSFADLLARELERVRSVVSARYAEDLAEVTSANRAPKPPLLMQAGQSGGEGGARDAEPKEQPSGSDGERVSAVGQKVIELQRVHGSREDDPRSPRSLVARQGSEPRGPDGGGVAVQTSMSSGLTLSTNGTSAGATSSTKGQRRLTQRDLFKLDDMWDMEVECAERPSCVVGLDSKLERIGSAPPLTKPTGLGKLCNTILPILHPESRVRLAWALGCAVLIGYEMVIVPMQLSKLVPESKVLASFDCVLFTYWCFDLVLNFRTGYYEDGVAEVRPRKVAIKYLKTWFLCDAMIIVSDVVFFALLGVDSSAGAEDGGTQPGANTIILRTSWSLSAMRLLRLFRLLRLRKLAETATALFDSVHTELGVVFSKIAALVISIALLVHYIACMWYALAANAKNDSDTWLTTTSNIESGDLVHSYFASFHWAVCQFTPATQDVAPVNLAERAFASAVVLLALVTFSSFLSKMTSAMTQLINLNAGKWHDEAVLRKFVRDNNLSTVLARQIWNTYRHQAGKKELKLRKQDIDRVLELPVRVQMKLSAELHTSALQHMPVFARAASDCPDELPLITHYTLSEHLGSPLQEVFHSNNSIGTAICLLQGSMGYQIAKTSEDQYIVKQFEWICEGALWGNWVTRGTLVSKSTTSRLECSAEKLRMVVTQYCSGFMWQALRNYALMFSAMVDHDSVTDVVEGAWSLKFFKDMADAAFGGDRGDRSFSMTMPTPPVSRVPRNGMA